MTETVIEMFSRFYGKFIKVDELNCRVDRFLVIEVPGSISLRGSNAPGKIYHAYCLVPLRGLKSIAPPSPVAYLQVAYFLNYH